MPYILKTDFITASDVPKNVDDEALGALTTPDHTCIGPCEHHVHLLNAVPPRRVISTNKRTEIAKETDTVFWLGLVEKCNPVYWFSKPTISFLAALGDSSEQIPPVLPGTTTGPGATEIPDTLNQHTDDPSDEDRECHKCLHAIAFH